MASLSTSESSGLPEPFIRQWREAVASKDQVDDHGIFQRYYEVCEKLFDALMEYCSHSSTVNEHHLKIINRSRKLFQLWGIETDIEKGEVDHRFLRGSNKDLKNLSLTLLTSIGDTLIHKLISYLTGNPEAVLSLPTSTAVEALREEARYHAADDGDCSDDNSSDTENESATLESTTEKIEDAVLHLQQCIEHLIYLIKPIQNNEPSNSGRQTAERRPQDLLADLVRIKLPKAHNDIIALLGELAWDVRQRKPNAKEQHKETVGEVSARPDDIRTLSNDLSRRDDSGLGSSLPTELLTEEPSRLRHSENRGHISSCGLNEEDKNWVMKLLIDRAAGRDSSRIPCPVCQKSLTKGRPKFLRHIADHIEEINFILSPASSRQCSDAGSSPADPSRPHFSDNLPAMGLGPESPTNRGEGNDLTGSMDPTAFFSVRRSSEEISGLRRGPFSQHQQYLDEPPLSPLLEYLEQHQTWSFDTANNNNNAAQQQLRGEDADALSGPPGLLEQRHKRSAL
ncbi:MAG: hypothetical protein M1822_008526 [Bathelium mastoideum]|nr:MAG: hypothetical protein M1822_008526 [Bathelium mastoideum]